MLVEEGNIVDCAANVDYELNIDINQELHDIGVKFYEVPFNRNPLSLQNLKAFRMLKKIQEKNQYDIVHVHTPIASVYGRLLKIKFPNIKTIYTVHGFHFYKGAPMVNWMIYYPVEKLMAKFTDSIITINKEDYERAKKLRIKNTYKMNGVGVDLVGNINNDVDKINVRKKLNIKTDDFVIIMIAEVNKNKNHKQIIKALKILKDKGLNNIKVICAGDGTLLHRIEKLIQYEGLNENIKMLGFRTDINTLISISDIGVMMSYREGLPKSIMELMANKKAVIGTNIRGISDLVKDGYNGFLVEVDDIYNTANKIEYLFRNREILNEMSINSYDLVKSYEINNIAKLNKEILDCEAY